MRRPSRSARKVRLVDITDHPLKHGWSLITDSPETLFKAMAGAIQDTGYGVRRRSPELKRGMTPSTPSVTADISGQKRLFYVRPIQLLLGIAFIAAAVVLFLISVPGHVTIADGFIMAVGVAFSVGGVLLFDDGYRIYRLVLAGRIEAHKQEPESNHERYAATTEIHATCVPMLRGIRNKPVDWVKGSKEQQVLKEDFEELTKRVQSLVSSHTVK